MPMTIDDAKKLGKDYKQAGYSKTQLQGVLQNEANDVKNAADSAWDGANAPSSGGSGGSQQSIRTLGVDTIAQAMSAGTSTKGEMSSQYKVNQKDLFSLTSGQAAFQNEILKQLERESELHTNVNEKMGITGELSRSYRDTILETVPLAATLGFDISHITDMVTTLGEKSGRFNLLSQETMEHSLVTTRAFGTSMRDMAEAMSEFEKVGIGAANTLDEIDAAGRSSLSLGLNAKKTTEMLKADIGKLNEFGFANGVQGLNRMVQKSLEFRMNMGEVFKIAEKVMSPDSAIELTANLQVLGGAIGDFNDPLKLMYMATNNVEGLQDALIGAAGNLATYNEEQGRFELKGANLRRAQEMAKQLGIDYKEFAKGAIASQERIVANNTLLAKGFDMSDKDREFLTNMSQMKDGHMTITIPKSIQSQFADIGKDGEVRLDQLSQNQIEVLKANRKAFEEMNPEDVAKAQFSSVKNIENMLQGAGLKAVKTAKDTTFGKNEIEDSGIIKLEKIAKETLTWTTEFSDKMLKNQETKFTAELKNIMDGLKSFGETYIEGPMKATSNFLREQLLGNTSADYLKTRKKEQDEKYERSDPRTNEFVIKSQINVVSTGFNNQPIIEKRGVDYITPIKTK
jgi:hypothetical protein